jgi:hypothetical protein
MFSSFHGLFTIKENNLKFKIIFYCCHKQYDDIKTHNIKENHDANIIIQCSYCKINQEPSNQCLNCDMMFNKFYCGKCTEWKDVKTYHCNNCNNCFTQFHRCSVNNIKESFCYLCIKTCKLNNDKFIKLKNNTYIHESCLYEHDL